MILSELKVPELKAELERRGLPTSGNKDKLLIRLREAMEKEGLDPESHEFDNGVEEEVEQNIDDGVGTVDEPKQTKGDAGVVAEVTAAAPAYNFDFGKLLNIIEHMSNKLDAQEVMTKQMSTKLEQKLDVSQKEMSTKMEQNQKEMSTKMEQNQKEMSKKFDAIQGENREAQDENRAMFQQMTAALRERVDEIEAVVGKVDERVEKVEVEVEKVQDEIQRIEKELHAVKLSGTTSQIIQQVGAMKLKPPVFDGTSSFAIFKLQFETAAASNHWTNDDRVAALIVALKNGAAETLQIVPEQERKDYAGIMGALERRYGGDHKRQIYRLELKSRSQRIGETLQEFASDIERLAHLANSNTSPDCLERSKIDAFVDGIRDQEVKRAVVVSPKLTFAETVTWALTNEAALATIKPPVKVRQVEINDAPSNNRWAPRSRGNEDKIKCWVCDKMGHISRNCRESRRKRARTPSPVRRKSREETVSREGEADSPSLN